MKTFKDLKFEKHPMGDGLQAIEFFPNSYGISCIRGKLPGANMYFSYTRNEDEWECAILKGNEKQWGINDNEVVGYLTEQEVTELMEKIQRYEANT